MGAQDNEGETPLHEAARGGHGDLVDFLLGEGVAVSGLVPHESARAGRSRRSKTSGAKPARTTPLVLSLIGAGRSISAEAHLAIAWKLIRRGADLQAKGHAGQRPLHVAVAGGHQDLAEHLIEKGVDVDAPDRDGGTALMVAAKYGQEALVDRLLEAGARVSLATRLGYTALHGAARAGSPGAVSRLISAGAKVNAEDGEGRTPVQVAQTREVRLLLERHGGRPGTYREACRSVASIAAENEAVVEGQAFRLTGREARVFLAFDPYFSHPDFEGPPDPPEADARLARGQFLDLMEAGIDEVVAWKFKRPKGMGAAVPFREGCAVNGYGEPDMFEKLQGMRRAAELVTSRGPDSSIVRRAVAALVRDRHGDEAQMVEAILDKVRPQLSERRDDPGGSSRRRPD
jgi:ankyrin repeat protein